MLMGTIKTPPEQRLPLLRNLHTILEVQAGTCFQSSPQCVVERFVFEDIQLCGDIVMTEINHGN